MNDWYPNQDAKRAAFLQNLVVNIPTACATLQLAPSTFDVATTAAQTWLTNYTARLDAQKKLNTALASFQKQAPDTEKNMRAAAKQIEGMMNVPTEVLALLELTSTSAAPATRVAAQTPRLTAAVELGTVVLKYQKLGHQAVLLYSCRTGEDAFSLLGTYTLNRIQDTRLNRVAGQPEQRQYYAIYMDRDQPTGGQSPTVSAVVGDKPVGELLR